MAEHVVALRDGRRLAVSVSGPEGGVPLLHHHGTPGCLHQPAASIEECARRGLRLVTYTRAGGEGSTRNPGRSVADVASDMEDVLDFLGAERCIAAGKSGGGPHALASAALLPDRVAAVISIAGVMPSVHRGEALDGFLAGMGALNVEGYSLARQGEWAYRAFVLEHRAGLEDADGAGVIAELESLLPEVDRAVLTSEVGEDLAAGIRGGVSVPDGWVDDGLAFVKDWGFDPGDIAVPAYVWHGSADLMVPFHHGQWLLDRIPGAVGRLREGEGHFSISLGAFGQMLDEAMAHL